MDLKLDYALPLTEYDDTGIYEYPNFAVLHGNIIIL